jgi:TrmH family RNA methyltransferase
LKQRLDRLQVVGTSAKAKIPIREYDFSTPTILLVGNETNGLSDAYKGLADAMVTIPMIGSATSFNIACAVSILLYEVACQRGL